VLIWENAPRDGDQVRQILARRLDFEEYRRSARLIESVSLAGRTRPLLRRGGIAQSRMAGVVMLSLFRETLGVEAGIGRASSPRGRSWSGLPRVDVRGFLIRRNNAGLWTTASSQRRSPMSIPTW
jgi:hypothetical protein